MDRTAIPRRRRSARFRNFRGSLWVTGAADAEAIEVTGVGAFALLELDGRRSVEELARAVAAEYEVDVPTAAADLNDFLDELLQWGIIEMVNGQG